MLFHASIGAREPARAAAVIAELWRGSASPFPAFPGSWIAVAGDDRGSAIEVYPVGQVLMPGASEAVSAHDQLPERATETHLAIATPLEEDHLLAIAAREGWIGRTCSRGGYFRVFELWLDNRVLIEVLTPAMQVEYRRFATPGNFEAALAEANRRLDAAA